MINYKLRDLRLITFERGRLEVVSGLVFGGPRQARVAGFAASDRKLIAIHWLDGFSHGEGNILYVVLGLQRFGEF